MIDYYIHGTHPMDIDNFKHFINSTYNKIRIIIERVNSKKHDYYFKDVNDIYERTLLLNGIKNLKISKT